MRLEAIVLSPRDITVLFLYSAYIDCLNSAEDQVIWLFAC